MIEFEYSGKLITFEGIEGSGKSTLAVELHKYLKSKNYEVVFTREPGGTILAEKIREILLSRFCEISDWTELFLFLASRYEHTKSLILPSLKSGKIVICDRYLDSTIAYQGYGRGLNLEIINNLNAIATLGIKPDITFLIDIPEHLAVERIKNKNLDRIESENIEFYRRVRLGYLEIAKIENSRFVILDGQKEILDLKSQVIELVSSKL
ncbi:MAG: dTMP kinase [candidate division WOR-3 bacterium]|nr:dTMP kinase [candidate division WOR-3 bacterium]